MKIEIKSKDDLPKYFGEYETNLGRLYFRDGLWKLLAQTRTIIDFVSFDILWYIV